MSMKAIFHRLRSLEPQKIPGIEAVIHSHHISPNFLFFLLKCSAIALPSDALLGGLRLYLLSRDFCIFVRDGSFHAPLLPNIQNIKI